MLFKRRKVERPELPKEYVWELDVLGEDHTYSCVVTETMVTTYEDGVEKKHLKVTNPECEYGVLQIDTVTALFGDLVPFQLERFIPYIMLDGKWVSSDTTKQDRLDATIASYKKESRSEIIVGVLGALICLIKMLVTGSMGDWSIGFVFSLLFIFAGITTYVRLRTELKAMNEAIAKQETESEKNDAEEEEEEILEIPQGLGAPKAHKSEE